MVYLDSAATSLLKPDTVQYAVSQAMGNLASPGRGSYAASEKAAELCFRCRENLARLFHVPEPDQVVFTFNATHGLNIAIRSLVRPGGRVVISGFEHNAVTRPLAALGARVVIAAAEPFAGQALLRSFGRRLEGAEAAVFTHVSNVYGCILPIEAMAAMCRERGLPFVVDASQSAGALDLDFTALGADFVAMPGHKGLLGPQGTGVLLCKGSARPLLYGGSGSNSAGTEMPDFLPDRLEAGTLNVAGIAGLNAGVEYILKHGLDALRKKELALTETAADALKDCRGLRIFAAPKGVKQAAVLSVVPEVMSCETLGERLSQAGIAVRTGLHCAPLAHKTGGTFQTGTLRMSFSPFNTAAEVLYASDVLKKNLK